MQTVFLKHLGVAKTKSFAETKEYLVERMPKDAVDGFLLDPYWSRGA